jgi:hypothetical protein
MEQTGFKINFMFDYTLNTTFGININQPILHSIISKALKVIDTDMISERWIRQTYDYRFRNLQRTMPLMVGLAITFLTFAVYVTIMHLVSKQKQKTIAEQSAKLVAMYHSFPDLIFSNKTAKR